MIRFISINHHATKNDELLYNSLLEVINFDEKYKVKNINCKFFDEGCPIHSIKMYYLDYEKWGRLYFIEPIINVPVLFDTYIENDLSYHNFIKLVHKVYTDVFNESIADKMIDKDHMLCTYVEFTAFMTTDNSFDMVNNLNKYSFEKQQLDINDFDNYKLKNAYITFTVNAINKKTIRLCAKCPNTALKKIFKMEGLGYIKAKDVFNKNLIADVLEKQVKKYTKPFHLEFFNRTNIFNGI